LPNAGGRMPAACTAPPPCPARTAPRPRLSGRCSCGRSAGGADPAGCAGANWWSSRKLGGTAGGGYVRSGGHPSPPAAAAAAVGDASSKPSSSTKPPI
jgi:hypothetical protein